MSAEEFELFPCPTLDRNVTTRAYRILVQFGGGVLEKYLNFLAAWVCLLWLSQKNGRFWRLPKCNFFLILSKQFSWNRNMGEIKSYWTLYGYPGHRSLRETPLKLPWNTLETSLKYPWNVRETPLKVPWNNLKLP